MGTVSHLVSGLGSSYSCPFDNPALDRAYGTSYCHSLAWEGKSSLNVKGTISTTYPKDLVAWERTSGAASHCNVETVAVEVLGLRTQ